MASTTAAPFTELVTRFTEPEFPGVDANLAAGSPDSLASAIAAPSTEVSTSLTEPASIGKAGPMEAVAPASLASINKETSTVYCVALIQYRGSSLVFTHHTSDIQVTLDRPVNL